MAKNIGKLAGSLSARIVGQVPDVSGSAFGAAYTRSAHQVKKPMTEQAFLQHLLEIGLMTELPDHAADYDDPDDEPVEIKGEPLSETIIRERR